MIGVLAGIVESNRGVGPRSYSYLSITDLIQFDDPQKKYYIKLGDGTKYLINAEYCRKVNE